MLRRTKRIVQKPEVEEPLASGTVAPGFSLMASTGDMVSLGDFVGRPVILVFFPAAWSPVCGDQLTLYNEIVPLFEEYNAQVLAISVDGVWCHRAFAENRNIRFPLLTDFHPKGVVAQAYGVYDRDKGLSQRALFVVDGEGLVYWSHISPSNVNPGADGILSALESLSH